MLSTWPECNEVFFTVYEFLLRRHKWLPVIDEISHAVMLTGRRPVTISERLCDLHQRSYGNVSYLRGHRSVRRTVVPKLLLNLSHQYTTFASFIIFAVLQRF